MATLISPGVMVTVSDESYYASAGQGTVPLIIIATQSNKTAASGTGIAPLTVPSEAGKIKRIGSQRELIQGFGNPYFYSSNGTSLHGFELNEYGLHAAYQYLGLSNTCYVIRADIDLAQLRSSASAPRSPAVSGTFWLDLSTTRWGVFQSNGGSVPGTAWRSKTTLLPALEDCVSVGGVTTPRPTYGSNGDFAVVTSTTENNTFERVSTVLATTASSTSSTTLTFGGGTAGVVVGMSVSGTGITSGSTVAAVTATTVTLSANASVANAASITFHGWFEIGSVNWKAVHPTVLRGTAVNPTLTSGNKISINGTEVTLSGVDINAMVVSIGTNVPDIVAKNDGGRLMLTNKAGGDILCANVASFGTLATALGLQTTAKKGVQVFFTNDASWPMTMAAGDVWIKGTSANNGTFMALKRYSSTTGMWSALTVGVYPATLSVSDGTAGKDTAALTAHSNTPATGTVYLAYDAATGGRELRRYTGTQFETLVYEASASEPTTNPADGTLWYNGNIVVDVMVGNGQNWKGYLNTFPNANPTGVLVSGEAPVEQSDGTALVAEDLWLDSSDLENFPALYRWDADSLRWRLIDKTDQTTPFGIVFADARQDSGVAYDDNGVTITPSYSTASTEIEDMLISNYVDPDAPHATAYPAGMLLFNTRYSTMNVKVWRPHWFVDGGFDPNTDFTQDGYTRGEYEFPACGDAARWVNASGNRTDGAMWAARKAQRQMVVRAMESIISSNQDLRSEIIYYNLMAAPGYPELLDEMILLNVDQKEVAFIVGDTPCRLPPTSNDIQIWATNALSVPSNGEEGLTAANPYVGLYYPWGLTTNTTGEEIMVPPSTIALRTIAYNDSVSYPWFAPAGYQRGLVSNAASVGYLTEEGEYKAVVLSPGQRDALYENKINPIAFIPRRGLVVFGQKTLNSLTTALDRINVSRLVNYLRYELDNIVKPFLFEQNDAQTRDAARLVVERFFHGLVGLRALEDFAVECSENNNTPERRDRNELWIDVAIKPLKAIEFIYVPVRIVNSSTVLS